MKNKLLVILFALALIICTALLLTGGNETNQAETVPRPEPQPAEVVESPYIEPTPEPSVATETEPATAEPSEVEQIEPEHEKPATTKPNAPKAEEPKAETSDTFKAIITHYCACSKCNGKYNRTEGGINYTATASGVTLHDGIAGNYCAATFGSLGDIITIDGIDYEIVDRMGGNDGKRVDIFVANGHARCNELGRYKAEVTIK